MTTEEIRLESLEIMNLKPNDILVFKLLNPCNEQCDHVRRVIKNELKLNNKVLIINSDEDISVIRKTQD